MTSNRIQYHDDDDDECSGEVVSGENDPIGGSWNRGSCQRTWHLPIRLGKVQGRLFHRPTDSTSDMQKQGSFQRPGPVILALLLGLWRASAI